MATSDWSSIDLDDYLARVQPTGIAELDEVIERMIKMGSVVVKADILSP